MSYSLFFKLSPQPEGQWVKRIAYENDQIDNVRTTNNIGIEVSTALFQRLVNNQHETRLTDVLSNKLINGPYQKNNSARHGLPNTNAINIAIEGFECFDVSIYKKRYRNVINLEIDLGEKQTKIKDIYKNVIRLNVHIGIFTTSKKQQPYSPFQMGIMYKNISECAERFKTNAIIKTKWLEKLDEKNLDQFNEDNKLNYYTQKVPT